MRSARWAEKAEFIIREDEAHVWRVELSLDASVLAACQDSLSTEEKMRAERFYFARHGRRFIIARGALRDLLSRYLRVSATEIGFESSGNGKPAVCHPSTPLRFNLSHSGDLCVIAFSAGTELGVDIEATERRLEALEIARRFFTPEEYAEIQQSDESKRVETFLRFWTAKEAVMKATGLGLRLEPAAIRVALDPMRIVSLRPDLPPVWLLNPFNPALGYVGTLATDPAILRFRFFDWSAAR